MLQIAISNTFQDALGIQSMAALLPVQLFEIRLNSSGRQRIIWILTQYLLCNLRELLQLNWRSPLGIGIGENQHLTAVNRPLIISIAANIGSASCRERVCQYV